MNFDDARVPAVAQILRDAGGHGAGLDGTPCTFANHATAEGLLCAPDEAGWRELRTARPGDAGSARARRG